MNAQQYYLNAQYPKGNIDIRSTSEYPAPNSNQLPFRELSCNYSLVTTVQPHVHVYESGDKTQ